MSAYVALLRGINVGRAKRVAMADLRELLGRIGCTSVRTLLQSGNAVFDHPGGQPTTLAGLIETALAEDLGVSARCLVWPAANLRALIAANPFPERAADGSKYLALFLSAALDPRLITEHDPRALAPDDIRLGDGVIYQWCPNGVLEAPAVGTFVERHFGVVATARNWNTVSKLGALVGVAD